MIDRFLKLSKLKHSDLILLILRLWQSYIFPGTQYLYFQNITQTIVQTHQTQIKTVHKSTAVQRAQSNLRRCFGMCSLQWSLYCFCNVGGWKERCGKPLHNHTGQITYCDHYFSITFESLFNYLKYKSSCNEVQ